MPACFFYTSARAYWSIPRYNLLDQNLLRPHSKFVCMPMLRILLEHHVRRNTLDDTQHLESDTKTLIKDDIIPVLLNTYAPKIAVRLQYLMSSCLSL